MQRFDCCNLIIFNCRFDTNFNSNLGYITFVNLYESNNSSGDAGK